MIAATNWTATNSEQVYHTSGDGPVVHTPLRRIASHSGTAFFVLVKVGTGPFPSPLALFDRSAGARTRRQGVVWKRGPTHASFRDKAVIFCSLRILRLATQTGHWRPAEIRHCLDERCDELLPMWRPQVIRAT